MICIAIAIIGRCPKSGYYDVAYQPYKFKSLQASYPELGHYQRSVTFQNGDINLINS
ncbi:Uncharacterized protein dnm_081920 [Desulfonema magnum]|uniref:Uncharacterized protein n=1 Tax=Desulfonema magnum TaxID=45655 RepID=A0A975BV82_9BACT|nr:Uncharacterized protein dnm_081920 [Desulfonema magnum]